MERYMDGHGHSSEHYFKKIHVHHLGDLCIIFAPLSVCEELLILR